MQLALLLFVLGLVAGLVLPYPANVVVAAGFCLAALLVLLPH